MSIHSLDLPQSSRLGGRRILASSHRVSLPRRPAAPRPKRLGAYLVEMGAITPATLAKALVLQQREDARLGEILLANKWTDASTILRAVALQHGLGLANLSAMPTDRSLIDLLPRDVALKYTAIPWSRNGHSIVIATAHPEAIPEIRASLPAGAGVVHFAVAPEKAILQAIQTHHGYRLAREAEARPPAALSCRSWGAGQSLLVALLFCAGLLTVLAPALVVTALTSLALGVLAVNTALKLMVLRSHWSAPAQDFATARQPAKALKLPKVSLLIPLHKEPRIAGPLIQRMSRLDYPPELLDILLVVEENDHETLAALRSVTLPATMRLIIVPDGNPKTKPRAMNYALSFARGLIVGVYDAEDAPSADQIQHVVRRFAQASPETACLQGRLDYYNARENWISRCFTIEYASWFRVFLPALERMGLPLPLGGTTLFFRRDLLEEIGGWDAHNVTEDADLGMRLARAGYKTEVIKVTTEEEANSALWAWVKQRSRWNKGYLMTWSIHNRRPFELFCDLGLRGWLGFQALFLGTLLGFLLTPLLLATTLGLLGWQHPFFDATGPSGIFLVAGLITLSSLTTLTLNFVAVQQSPHLRFLSLWVPTCFVYNWLNWLSMMKALIETLLAPFYWDKTAHGAFGGDAHGVQKDAFGNLKSLPPVLPDQPASGGLRQLPLRKI